MPQLPRSHFKSNRPLYTVVAAGIFVLAVILSMVISWAISSTIGSNFAGRGFQANNFAAPRSSVAFSGIFNPLHNSIESKTEARGNGLAKLGPMGLPTIMESIFIANLLMALALALVSIIVFVWRIIGQKLGIPIEYFSEVCQSYSPVSDGYADSWGSSGHESDDATEHTKIVLIADDDTDTRLLITNALVSDGLGVEYATNGQEALSKFKSCQPDLVIMNEVMPIMTGFDACFQINQTSKGRNTPILMVMALGNDESIETAFKIGATDFIPKPINSLVLRHRVKRVLEARQSEKRVERLVYIDGLTGLPNRTACADRLVQDLAFARRNASRLAILFIGIDHFQDINDNLGRAAGDTLLRFIAERVGGCVRSEDTLARLGGDEFVVILSSVKGSKGVDTVAKTLLKILSTPFHIADREVCVGVSIGISMYPEDGSDRETILKNADTAMHRAKALGRNNYQFYTFEMSTSISDRIELETDLRTACENEELILYYQPKVDSDTQKIWAPKYYSDGSIHAGDFCFPMPLSQSRMKSACWTASAAGLSTRRVINSATG